MVHVGMIQKDPFKVRLQMIELYSDEKPVRKPIVNSA